MAGRRSSIREVGVFLIMRVTITVPVLLASTMIIFLVMAALPGDAALTILSGSPHTEDMREVLREELGLDDPLPVQYLNWLKTLTDGSFGGISLETKEPVRLMIRRQLPVTALLAMYAAVVGVLFAVPLGTVSAVYKNRWPDRLIRILSMGGLSLPHVLTANIVLLVLLTAFRWSPPIVYAGPLADAGIHLQTMIWPALLLGWEFGSHLTRIIRAGTIEKLGEQYVTAARGRGLSEFGILIRYAFRNTLLPVITESGIQFGTLLSGAIVLESIFGLPGIGRGIIGAALARDYTVVMSVSVLMITAYLLLNTFIDISYTILDPRSSERIGNGTR